MAVVASAVMLRPPGGGLDPPYYNGSVTSESLRSKRIWPARLKPVGSKKSKSPDRGPDSHYFYGTISAPGGSALSKSMKYAETWLYGTLRGPPSSASLRPSIFNAYPDGPGHVGPVLISTPQKTAPNYAVIICSCSEYLNGTKKSNNNKVSICKKCKGSRLPLTVADPSRVLFGGTLRATNLHRDGGLPRSGTVKAVNVKSRPSILTSVDTDSNDPYDLMRRSRLAAPQESPVGSQFSTSKSRAKSISPPRGLLRHLSPPKDLTKKNRSKSVSRPKDLWIEEKSDHRTEAKYKRSILNCEVNPYQLNNTDTNSIDVDWNDNFDYERKKFNFFSSQNNNSSNTVKAIGGQRIKIYENSSKLENISVYDAVDFRNDLRKFDLKTEELSPCLSTKSEKMRKKTFDKQKNAKSSSFNNTLPKPKPKLNSPKRPPRRLRSLSKTDEDSESDHQRNKKKLNLTTKESKKNNDYKFSTIKNQTNIKSILKKPRNSETEITDSNNLEISSSGDERSFINSQFYVPTPASVSTINNRKRVQFMVESDDTKIIYTAEFDFFHQSVKSEGSHTSNEEQPLQNCIEMENSLPSPTIEISEIISNTEENENKTNGTEENFCNNCQPVECESPQLQPTTVEAAIPKITVLRRSESDRISTSVSVQPPKFLDTMALRTKHKKIHTSQVFLNKQFDDCSHKKIEDLISNYESSLIRIEENITLETDDPLKSKNDFENDCASDESDITKQVLKNLRRSISSSPEPPPRQKQQKSLRTRKNNYVKTRFIRSNSSSDEWSDSYDTDQRTILKIQPPENETNLPKNNQDDTENSYESYNVEPRRTSILINGSDCYSTMNSSEDAPIYLSSVVVNDSANISSYQPVTTVTICVNSNCDEASIDMFEKNDSALNDNNAYDGDTEKDPNESFEMQTECNTVMNNEFNHNNINKNLQFHDTLVGDESNCSPQTSVIIAENEPCDGFVSKLLKDPFLGHLAEGLDSNLVSQLIENSLLKLQETKTNSKESCVNKDEINVLIENSFKNIQLKESADKEKSCETNKPATENESNCLAPYESMDYESGLIGLNSDLDPLSDFYNASASELSTEDDNNSTRSKFYQMLVDATLREITNPDDDHLYESIRLNSDPIYEEISDMPPPLPINPPPSSISGDEEKKLSSRSIFEGASKYDILSYLVDAKERGIVNEETYISNYENDSESCNETKSKSNHERQSSDLIATINSDSSEDNSLVICNDVIEKTTVCKKTSAEIERNDSGVGSETSKSSRSRWQGRKSPEDHLNEKLSTIHLCEDCDNAVETQMTDSGAVFAPLVCRKCAKKRAERKEIITEIVETEEKYGRDLQIILEEFYKPMLVAGLLSHEQLSAIFLNVEELLDNNQTLSEKLRDALEIAVEQGDEDLLTVNIGKIMLECSHMLSAFQTYCVRQAGAALLLSGLEKDKELLRIFLRVSQMENTVLRRMNLNSFLMVPVQRVTKYPLLLSRLYRATPSCASERNEIMSAQRGVEARLEEMNAAAAAAAREVPLWRRLAAAKRTAHDLHVADIKLRKMAVDVLEWNHDDARFAMEGKLLFTQPNDNNWRKGRTIKLTPISALLVTNGKPTSTYKPLESSLEHPQFPKANGVREAALLLVREKAGRYTLFREPLYLDRCVIAADQQPDHFFEVHEITTKDSFIFKAEESTRTLSWYRALQYHAQGVGAWRKRRNALANIMINGMLTRN